MHVKLFPRTPWSCSQDTVVTRWTRCEAYFILHTTSSPVCQALLWQRLVATPDTLERVQMCACILEIHLQTQKSYVGFELISTEKLPTGTLSIIYLEYLLSQAISNGQSFQPHQFTSIDMQRWTGRWLDAQLLHPTVDHLHFSIWEDVRYLAGLPPRMSPDGLLFFAREKSSVPVPGSVSSSFPLLSSFP